MKAQMKKYVIGVIPVLALALTGPSLAVEIAPPPSTGGKMAYDAARGEAVLYGFITEGNVTYTQTWVWNGSWALKTPTVTPPGVKGGGMAYDEVRQKAVFFGGAITPTNCVSGFAFNTNTWLWDGTNWAMATPAVQPRGRDSLAMTYDPLRANVLVFGGSLRTNCTSSAASTNDTWVWNGSDWTLMNPTNRPAIRGACGLTFDAASGQTVLFGGMDNTGGGGDYDDTWTWDGTNWAKKLPATSPSKRTVNGMVYDSVRREVVLFGGFTNRIAGDTWTWNGTNWSQKTPATRPSARAGHAMVFDPVRGKTMMFGGQTNDSVPSLVAETWLWDGTNWQSSDLTLSLVASSGTVFLGDNLTYNVIVTNNGPSLAEEVRLVEELPGGVEFVSAFASQGSCSYAGGTLACNLGSLSVGTTALVSVVVTPQVIGPITNTATVLCSAELQPSSNVRRVEAMVVSPPLVNTPLTNQTAAAGGQIVLGVDVGGSLPLSYEWYLSGTNLVGQGTPWLSLTNLDWSQSGYYSVVVSNPYGSVTNTALLSVNDLHLYAGIRIGGAPGANYQVFARDSLHTNDAWFVLTNFTLPYSPYLFIDEESPNRPQRFYQVTSP